MHVFPMLHGNFLTLYYDFVEIVPSLLTLYNMCYTRKVLRLK